MYSVKVSTVSIISHRCAFQLRREVLRGRAPTRGGNALGGGTFGEKKEYQVVFHE